ncbi:MAG: HEPN domain-containing protein [Blastocatellia bacterium]
MDPTEQARRWTNAKEKLQAAQLCFGHQLYGESLTRSYYACYQAMWAAVGDTPLGMWRHGGLINEFCRGRWTSPILLPTALASLRRKLDELYRLRISVDYAATAATDAEAQSGLDTTREVLQTIAHHTGWVL